jgi:SPOR domain
MSRSNDPTAQAGGQSQQWRQLAELDLALRPSPQAPHQPHQWPTQANAGQPQYAYPGAVAGQSQLAHPGQPSPHPALYHYPQGAPPDAGYGFDGAGARGQSPAFSALSAQTSGYGAYAQQYEQAQFIPPSHNTGFPPLQTGAAAPPSRQSLAGGAVHEPQPELRGATYDQWPASHDPGGYDLGSYMPSAAANQGAYDARYQSAGHQLPHSEAHWPDYDGFGDHTQDPAALGAYGQPYAGHESLPVAGQSGDHEDSDYEVEEPRRGYRGVAIVAALVAAIVSGGGLAYAYKTFVDPGSKTAAPVVKADNRPAKTLPADPGGKQFAHQDSKLMGRLGEEGSDTAAPQPSNPPSSESAASGVRKVSTVVVGRDGSIAAPAAEAPPRLPPPTVEVPGMMIVDGFGGRGSVATSSPRRAIELVPQPPVAAQAAPSAPPPTPIRPQVITKVKATAAPAGLGAEAPPAPAPQQKKAQRATPVANLSAWPPGATTTAPAVKSGSAGYVVVLSSQKSRMDALKAFADLQQKYGGVLASKVPDVREADLSARGLGTVYRVMVGPPGPREAANKTCEQLKSAGFTGCWVTAQ